MDLLSQKRFQRSIGVVCLLAALLYLVYYLFLQYQSRTITDPAFVSVEEKLAHGGRGLPKEGVSINETNDRIPGDMENGRKSLREVYHIYSVYRDKIKGKPFTFDELMLSALHDCTQRNCKDYGYSDLNDFTRKIGNSDNQYHDNPSFRHQKGFFFAGGLYRPDGNAPFGPKKPGERDVIAYNDTYVHENIRYFPGERSTSNPFGYYQVLWDDGKIEDVPYDKVRFVVHQIAPHRWSEQKLAFPGQAGIPADALSYDDYWKQVMGFRIPPHGKPGALGTAYNGQTYRSKKQ